MTPATSRQDAASVTLAAGRPEPLKPPEPNGEWLAERFHTLYESLAPAFGYETRRESAVAWSDVPKRNKALMRTVAMLIEADLRERIVAEIDVVATADLTWLREHADDQLDRARLMGAEDAYRAAMNAVLDDPDGDD